MDTDKLKIIEKRFIDYVESFFCNDQFINFNLHLKLCHSLKVRQAARYIAKGIGLSDNDVNLAETIGLLHDVGRFPQFLKYQTYKDSISVDHGKLGADEIIKNKMVDGLDVREQNIIDKAVRVHGLKNIPSDFADDLLLHTKIIRDADKLDIFRVVVFGYRLYKNNPDKYPYDLEYPENGEYSSDVYQTVMKRQVVDYKLLRTMNDARLLQLAWVFDLNFRPSIKRLADKGYLDELFSYFAQNDEIAQLRAMIDGFISKRLQAESGK